MAKAILNLGLDTPRTVREGYSFKDDRPSATWRRRGHGKVTASPLAAFDLRTWSWPIGLDEVARAAWLAFMQGVGWVRDSFLLQDPRDGVRLVTLEPAVGDGARVLFSLPTVASDPDYPFFPADSAIAHGVVAGVDKALASIDVDGRTVTFAAAPGIGLAAQLSYQPLRLVRLSAPPEVQSVARVFVMPTLDLEQVVRD